MAKAKTVLEYLVKREPVRIVFPITFRLKRVYKRSGTITDMGVANAKSVLEYLAKMRGRSHHLCSDHLRSDVCFSGIAVDCGRNSNML